MSEAEIERLIGEVARTHDLLLSRDDPILVSVTLNEQILADVLRQLRGTLEQAKQEIGLLSAKQTEAAKSVAEQLITAAAGYIADEVRAAAAEIGVPVPTKPDKTDRSRQSAAWLAAIIAVSAACLSGALALAAPFYLEISAPQAHCQASSAD